jgi:hypothetical protein
MLAVCSDLDGTEDRHLYHELMRFLNTSQPTALGPGVGLETGNTIYFDMPPDQFAYWNTDDVGREMVRTLIRSGHIDCLHSFGDLATTRSHAGRALRELIRHDCRLEVWIDHRTARTNFGGDIMRGMGDLPGSEAYHTDLTCDFGVKYVWRGRVTSVIGQEVRPSLRGLFTPKHPLASARTVAKEAAKNVLGHLGDSKYEMHASNCLLRRTHLRDGRPVYEFLRSNPHWGGVSTGETGHRIGQVLTDAFLGRLARREGACVLYTHLGKVRNPRVPFDDAAIRGFRRLAAAHQSGSILVTTTHRLLRFCRAVRELSWTTTSDEHGLRIDVDARPRTSDESGGFSGASLDGLTFYVPDPRTARLFVDGREVPDLRRNPADHTGRGSVSLPWPKLEFPSL